MSTTIKTHDGKTRPLIQTDTAYPGGHRQVIVSDAGGAAETSLANIDAATGATTDAAVTDDNQGTISAKLRGINKILGTLTDAAVVGDNSGSISAKLRGIDQILNDVWNSTNHRLQIGGGVAAGAAAVAKPVEVGGVDGGGLLRSWLMDTSGRGQIVGAAATGAAVAGNPVLVGGTDGTNAQAFATGLAAISGTTPSNVLDVYLATSNGTTFQQVRAGQDGLAITRTLGVMSGVYNGSTFDMPRAANTAAATTGTGLLGVGTLLWDGTNFQLCKQATSSVATSGAGVQGVSAMMFDGSNFQYLSTGSRTADANTGARTVSVDNRLFNEVTFDRQRNNSDVTLQASAAKNATQTFNVVNYNGRGITVVVDMTAIGAGTTWTVTINNKDGTSGKFINVLTGAAISGNTTNTYRIYPGLTPVTNIDVNGFVTRDFQVVITEGGTPNSSTFSVGLQNNL